MDFYEIQHERIGVSTQIDFGLLSISPDVQTFFFILKAFSKIRLSSPTNTVYLTHFPLLFNLGKTCSVIAGEYRLMLVDTGSGMGLMY